jgi:hypothetical protein
MKKVLFATMFMAVVSASAFSLRQLGTSTHLVLTCGSACVKTDACQKPCYCFVTDPSSNTGVLPARRPGTFAAEMS